ncbi:MAG: immunoglobulin domain-containing protein [Sedimentisphaerales bacterium]|nr:immunoglobulin domain-containing protein [Sedimentisphaerales bacterium]
MKKFIFGASLMALAYGVSSADAATKAYWRFEGGVADQGVPHTTMNVYTPDIVDVSGNGYDLSCFNSSTTPGGAIWRASSAGTVRLSQEANLMCVQNSGANPGMYTGSVDLRSWSPAQFTVEVTFKARQGDHRTFVGRDSYAAAPNNTGLSVLYVKVNPDESLGFTFVDVNGISHGCTSAPGIIKDYASAGDIATQFASSDSVPWYSMVARSDGDTMAIFLLDHSNMQLGYQLVAQTDISGFENTALHAGQKGSNTGTDWVPGNFTVGRGMFNGIHADRAHGLIDEVRISDVALAESEFLFAPAVGSPIVTQTADVPNGNVDTTFSWTAPVRNGVVIPEIADQYLFANTKAAMGDPNLYFVANTGDPGSTALTSYGPMDLDFDNNYRWRVISVITGKTTTLTAGVSKDSDVAYDPNCYYGTTWSFASLPSTPVITSDPVGGYIAVGGSINLTVAVDSVTTPVYTWYFSKDNIIGDDVVVGTDSDSYAITEAVSQQQGYYYCSVTNDSQSVVNSAMAFVEIAQMVAYYNFENTLNDSTLLENHGTAVYFDGTAEIDGAEVAFGPGFGDGNALILGQDEMKHIRIPCPVRSSYTMEAWVKTSMTAAGGDWWFGAGIIDGEMSGQVADFGTVLSGSKFAMGSGPSSRTIRSAVDINDGQWHYCVATRDIDSGEIKLYVDGHREATTVTDKDVIYSVTDVLNIGKVRLGHVAGKYFVGAIDEVKIYNYAIDELTIARNYVSMVPGEHNICIETLRPEGKYDINGDCVVDIKDFAILAANWLESGLYPN